MGVFSFCPNIERCCGCKGSLKIAVLCIVFLTMLAGGLALAMCLYPTCQDMFDPNSKGIVDLLNIFKWIFFTFTVLVIVSCFVFFLAMFLQNFPHRSIPADVYVGISFVWALTAFLFAVLQMVHYVKSEIKCSNPNDFITVLLFVPCMLYFTCIVNSYIGKAEVMD